MLQLFVVIAALDFLFEHSREEHCIIRKTYTFDIDILDNFRIRYKEIIRSPIGVLKSQKNLVARKGWNLQLVNSVQIGERHTRTVADYKTGLTLMLVPETLQRTGVYAFL